MYSYFAVCHLLLIVYSWRYLCFAVCYLLQVKQHWLHVYNNRAKKVQQRLHDHNLWLSQNEQLLSTAPNHALNLTDLEKQIEDHSVSHILSINMSEFGSSTVHYVDML